jgi:hypothetical protein
MGRVLRTLARSHPTAEGPDYAFFCPGCESYHVVWVKLPNSMVWTFNGNMERPTFKPSLKLTEECWWPPVGPENLAEWQKNPWPQTKKVRICHVVVTDGVLNFCEDSTHSLAGKSVPMVEVGDNANP